MFKYRCVVWLLISLIWFLWLFFVHYSEEKMMFYIFYYFRLGFPNILKNHICYNSTLTVSLASYYCYSFRPFEFCFMYIYYNENFIIYLFVTDKICMGWYRDWNFFVFIAWIVDEVELKVCFAAVLSLRFVLIRFCSFQIELDLLITLFYLCTN